jgi:hypothetical protein
MFETQEKEILQGSKATIFMGINQVTEICVSEDGLICVKLKDKDAPLIPLCAGDDDSVERFKGYFDRMRIHAS